MSGGLAILSHVSPAFHQHRERRCRYILEILDRFLQKNMYGKKIEGSTFYKIHLLQNKT